MARRNTRPGVDLSGGNAYDDMLVELERRHDRFVEEHADARVPCADHSGEFMVRSLPRPLAEMRTGAPVTVMVAALPAWARAELLDGGLRLSSRVTVFADGTVEPPQSP